MDADITHGRSRPANAALVLTAVVGLIALLWPSTAMARPEMERFHDQFGPVPAPGHSAQCGVEVEATFDVRGTHKSFDDDPLRHRTEEKGTIEWSSDHGTVIESFRHAGVHEVVEVLEQVEPDVFLVQVRVVVNGNLRLRTAEGRQLARDAGTVTFLDLALWDRSDDALIGLLERSVTRVAGPHPLLDDATYFEAICGELAP